MHSTSHDTVDDMITLFELEEYTILRNLCMRYKRKEIYVSNNNFGKVQNIFLMNL